jgi:hypothetical protein
MQGIIKNNIARALLSIFLAQALAPLAIFISIQVIKHNQERYIEEHFLQANLFETIILDEAEYETLRSRNEKEMIIRGTLYDIHSVRKEKRSYVILAISDEQEKQLEKEGEAFSDQKGKDKNTFTSLFFSMSYPPGNHAITFSTHGTEIGSRAILSLSLSETFRQVPTPPPDQQA